MEQQRIEPGRIFWVTENSICVKAADEMILLNILDGG